MRPKIFALLLTVFLGGNLSLYAQNFDLLSPNKEIRITVNLADKIYYTISHGNNILLEDNAASMVLNTGTLGENPKLQSKKNTTVDEVLTPVVPLKSSKVRNYYNNLLLKLKGNYSIEFRALMMVWLIDL